MRHRPVTNHAYLALGTTDPNTASQACNHLARDTRQLALVSYWEPRDHPAFELKIAASHDGVSTTASVGTLDPRRGGFTPAPPIKWLRGAFGDPLHDILEIATQILPEAVRRCTHGSLSLQGLKRLVTDTLSSTCRQTLAAMP